MKTFTCTEMGGVCETVISGETMEDVMKTGHEHVVAMEDDVHKNLVTQMDAGGPEAKVEWEKGFAVKWETKTEDVA